MPVIESNNTIGGTYGPLRTSGAPVNGVSGSHVGAATGATLVRTDTGVLYVNTGTAASPTWTVVGSQV